VAADRGDRRRNRDERRAREIEPGSAPLPTRPGVMVVNDTPGEECRIAILRDGLLEQLFMERSTTATQVGNIYKGRVTNVEPAIQAAFVDYGQGQAGFLHISDLHPRYFPSGDKTERVGKKTSRRDRPMMQEALRRGDEVIVQVLKQGIGTKGPTLTSYLSIAGRLLVMMPWMDKSGVSRKVDDEDQRREMKQILDSLNLPDGFGFILRTAGFDRTKLELQRDAAYLLRLWRVMEKRMKAVGAPCALYTESDLLIRSIRDVVDSSIDTIVVDSDSACKRARAFLEVVAPRSAPKVLYYDRQVPIFHAFDVERQIELTHSRIVPLRSGGALVIDQTEALVAIDVNSGKSRAARDSETNAFHTNLEAVEEIARQLRLRDLGGVVICDLIDMRSQRHRRDVEDRFREHLRRDRARATTAPISDFGILEMTRQRMRPSLRKTHYIDCPNCDGHGEIKMPDAVAGDALRSIAHLLHYERVKRVEMACSTRVASILLSGRRRMIDELEDRSGKRVEIRISEALALDRVDLYAYDERGADIDITKLPAVAPPKLADLPSESPPRSELEEDEDDDGGEEESTGGRRRRRRRKPAPADATTIALEGGFDDMALEFDAAHERQVKQAAADEERKTAGAAAASGGREGGGDARGTRRGGRDAERSKRGEPAAAGARAGQPDGRPKSGAGQGGAGRGPMQAPVQGPSRGSGQGPGQVPARGSGQGTGQGPGQAPPTQLNGAAAARPAGGPGREPERADLDADGDRRRRRRRRKGGLRLGDLAREVGVEPHDLVLRCRREKILNLQDELSRVPSEQAAMIRGWYGVTAPEGEAEFGDDAEGESRGGEGESRRDAHPGKAVAAAEVRGGGEQVDHSDQGHRRREPTADSEQGSAEPPSTVADGKLPRVFELAKELGVPSKELVSRCLDASVDGVRNHMSALSRDALSMVRSWYPSRGAATAKSAREAPHGAAADGAGSAATAAASAASASRGGGQSGRPQAPPAASATMRPAAISHPTARAAGVPAPPPAAPSVAGAARPGFRPLYSAGRSRKPLPVKRGDDRGE